MGRPMKLRDNQALVDELTILVHSRDQRQHLGSRSDHVEAIFAAFDRALAATGPGTGAACCRKGAKLAEDWVARYKCPTHGWQDNSPPAAPAPVGQHTNGRHPGHKAAEMSRLAATPPSGSPPPTFTKEDAVALGEAFDESETYALSGSPPGEAEAEPWVIVAAHLSTQGVAYFWGPNFSGYTRLVEQAGRYTEAEAKSREVWSERMEVAVRLSEILSASRPHVSDDDAHRWFHRRFPDGKPGRQESAPAPHVAGDPCYCRGGTNLAHADGSTCPASIGQESR